MHSLAAVSVLAEPDAQHQPPVELQQIGLGNSRLFVSLFLVMLCEAKILSCSCSKSIKLQERALE
jgi:hypothetical protein